MNKYFTGSKQRCLDNPPKINKGSPIFRLLLAFKSPFCEFLSWIHGNGRWMHIWEDKIMSNDYLAKHRDLIPLWLWMSNKGISTLFDISNWSDSSYEWTGWKTICLLAPLNPQYKSLLFSLHGCAPKNRRSVESQGWKGYLYIMNKGNHTLLKNSASLPFFGLWETVWNNDSLLKINFFSWFLSHKKVITFENLCNHGIARPS
jgi:hypothetical protein